MKIEKNSGSLPTWLDNFVCKFQTKTKIATKNVQNLPQVKWKNETYYVNLTDDGAVLYNDQANEVMSLDGVKSIDQVNDALNKDSIVASTDGNDSTDSQFSNEDEEKTVTSDFTIDTAGTGIAGESDMPTSDEPSGKDKEPEPIPNSSFGVDDNEKQDLAKDSEFESELEKVADLEDGMPQQEDKSSDAGQMAPEQTETTASVDGINEGVEDVSGQQHESINDISGTQHESIEEAGTDKYQNNANSVPDTDVNPDELVTKASYNRLLAKVKQLEKKLSAIDKKAEGYGGGVGFDDIANGISNAVSSIGDAASDAFDWAQQQSQGENGTFDARDSKKDVKCKHRLIAIADDSALKSFEQLNKESIPDTDDYSIDDKVNNSRGIDVGSVNNKKKHLIADIPEGGMNLTDLPGYSDAVQDVDMNGREEPPSSTMSDDPDSNDLHNAEQFGGIFGKKNNKTAFTEAQHAYTAPENNAYDLNSQDEEVKHFNDSANQTQKVLDKEHALDLSNMNDRAKLNEYFLLDLDNDIDDMVLDDEEIVPDETVKELTTEELPQEEIVEEDSPAVEEIEIPVAEDIPVIEDENPTILVLDNPESIEEFENQTCPICHQQKSLAGVQNAGDYIGVVCNHCGQEYAVGNDKIFVRK